MKVSLALLLLDRVFSSLYLNEALSYKGILIGPELVHNVLVFSQDEGKVPGKGNQMFLVYVYNVLLEGKYADIIPPGAVTRRFQRLLMFPQSKLQSANFHLER